MSPPGRFFLYDLPPVTLPVLVQVKHFAGNLFCWYGTYHVKTLFVHLLLIYWRKWNILEAETPRFGGMSATSETQSLTVTSEHRFTAASKTLAFFSRQLNGEYDILDHHNWVFPSCPDKPNFGFDCLTFASPFSFIHTREHATNCDGRRALAFCNHFFAACHDNVQLG